MNSETFKYLLYLSLNMCLNIRQSPHFYKLKIVVLQIAVAQAVSFFKLCHIFLHCGPILVNKLQSGNQFKESFTYNLTNNVFCIYFFLLFFLFVVLWKTE